MTDSIGNVIPTVTIPHVFADWDKKEASVTCELRQVEHVPSTHYSDTPVIATHGYNVAAGLYVAIVLLFLSSVISWSLYFNLLWSRKR